MKYNLGSGSCPIDGYENIDIKNGVTAYPLDIPDSSADEIRASHLLEHFSMNETYNVLNNWVKKLKVGGVLKIAVPNFSYIANGYISKINENISGYLMGGQTDEYDYHKSIFDKESLTMLMERAGLENIETWNETYEYRKVNDCSSLPVSLNLMGTRKKENIVNRTLSAIVSMPRLCFTDYMNCVMQELVANGIPVRKGCGVYWSQVLSRMMKDVLVEGSDYLLTMDYDSWFNFEHVKRLLSVMERNKDLDAVCALEMKRECDSPLMGIVDENGKPKEQILLAEFNSDYMPILTGHFGLTIFRMSSFHKLKKPWFLPIPDPNGEWEEGRVDDDIYFWHNFKESGLKAGVTTVSQIGHLQLVCTFPGTPQDGFKPIHVAINDLKDVNNIPEHCR